MIWCKVIRRTYMNLYDFAPTCYHVQILDIIASSHPKYITLSVRTHLLHRTVEALACQHISEPEETNGRANMRLRIAPVYILSRSVIHVTVLDTSLSRPHCRSLTSRTNSNDLPTPSTEDIRGGGRGELVLLSTLCVYLMVSLFLDGQWICMCHPPCMYGRSMDIYVYHIINTCTRSNYISACCPLLLSYGIKKEWNWRSPVAHGHSAILCLWCLLVCVPIRATLGSLWGHPLCCKRSPWVFAEGVQEDSGWSTIEPWRTRDDAGRSVSAADFTGWRLAQRLLLISCRTERSPGIWHNLPYCLDAFEKTPLFHAST